MNALKLALIASLMASATAHAAGDEIPVETIVVTAKRPAFIESSEPILVVTVTAHALAVPLATTIPLEDSIVLEPPQATPVPKAPRIDAPTIAIEPPKLSVEPPHTELALAETATPQG